MTVDSRMKLSKIIEKCKLIQMEFPDIIIGGSVSLILQKAIPFRIPKDIDLIVKNKNIINEMVVKYDIKNHRRTFKIDEQLFDIFYNPQAEYVNLGKLKLSPVEEIAKIKQNKIFGIKKKHIKDIHEISKHS